MDESYAVTRDGLLTREKARELTDQVKRDASSLWAALLELYNGNAWKALGYKSWAVYCATEFELGHYPAYRMLNAARVMDQLANGSRSNQLPMGNSPLPKNERVARELTPLRHDPREVEKAWADVVERHGPEPTATQVREVVRERKAPPPAPPKPPQPSWAARIELLTGELRHVVAFPHDSREHIDTVLALLPDVTADLERLRAETADG